MLPNQFQFWPKWRNFAKSGHTEREEDTQRERNQRDVKNEREREREREKVNERVMHIRGV